MHNTSLCNVLISTLDFYLFHVYAVPNRPNAMWQIRDYAITTTVTVLLEFS